MEAKKESEQNQFSIDEECKELKALIINLSYNNVYDEDGDVTVESGSNELELYSEINLRIDHLCQYIHKLQKDVYIQSEMVKVLKGSDDDEQDLQSL